MPASSPAADAHRLSPLQSLFWVDTLLNPDIPLNDVLVRVDIRGELDPDRFRRAFERLVAGTDALRVRIDRDAATLRIGPPEARLQVERARDEDEAAAGMHALVAEPFRPGEPLHRALLVQSGPARWSFLLDQHHAVADSTSCVALHHRLAELYEDEGKLIVDPGHFRGRLNAVQAPSARSFWQQQFKEPVPTRNYYGLRHDGSDALSIRARRPLSPQLSAALASGGAGRKLTAAAFAWMRRVASEDELCIGVPLRNRGPEEADAAGLFMEVCPNRIEVRESESFSELMARLDAHHDEVRPHRNATVAPRAAGYDVLVNHHPAFPTHFGKLPCRFEVTTPLNLISELGPGWPQERAVGQSEALSIHAHRRGDNYELVFDFNGTLWSDVGLRERVPTHFTRLLEHLVLGHEGPIGSFDILADDERRLLFGAVAGVSRPHDRRRSPVDAVFEHAEHHPDREAVVFEDRSVAYGELAADIERVAGHLQTHGAAPGALVAVCIERSERLPAVLLGVHRSGAAYVPLAPNHPPARNTMVLEDAKPVVLVGDGEGPRALAEGAGVPYLDLSALAEEAPPVEVHDRPDLAYVIFTSGSTGRPKGVRVRHRGVAAFLAAMAETPGFGPTDRILAVTTVTFDIAVLELFLPLYVGGSVRIAPHSSTVDGEALARMIDEGACTVFQATPATYRMMIAAGWAPRPRALKLLCGGEAMPPDLARGLLERAEEVWNMYGPTETTVWSTARRITRADRIDVGTPILGTRIYVANAQLQAVPIGVSGELLIGGKGLAEGYHDRPELTAEKFRPNPFTSSELVYRTGDRVRFCEDLAVEYLGRMDFQVKIRGFRIELPDIESHLDDHPSVAQAVVLAVPDASGELALNAYVKGTQGPPDPGALVAHLRERLPPYMLPSTFIPVEDFPLNTNGKVDRKAVALLERPTEALPGLQHPTDPPENQLQASLLGAWRMVLGRQDFGVNDDFFAIGGHSIMALELVRAMEQSTGLGISLGMIFERPTIKRLDEALAGRAASSPSIVVPLNDAAGEHPIYFLCGIDIYRPLAQTLPSHQPAFAVYVEDEQKMLEWAATGDDAQQIPVDTLAEAYYEAVTRQGPGPYRLAGVSFGGLLAFEVALRLEARGETVDWVVLLDSLLPSAVRRSWVKWVRASVHRARDEGFGPLVHDVRLKLAERILPPDVEIRRPDESSEAVGRDAREADVARARDRAFDRAAERYQARDKLKAPLMLVRAMDQTEWGPSVSFAPDYGWKPLVSGRFDAIDTPGGHIGMLHPPHVSALGQQLWTRLQRDA